MAAVHCPRCGYPVLSGRALYVLEHLPESMRRGKVIRVRELARKTEYSVGQAHLALQELSRAGYIDKQPVGAKKHIYRAVPQAYQQLSLFR